MKICVHTFRLSDSEDPEIYAAEPLYNWQQTEQGQWVLAHSIEQPFFTISVDHVTYGYQCKIFANLKSEDTTFFKLKWA